MKRNFGKTAEEDALDLGWQEGVFKDGRPFLGEFWCRDQISMITFFFSTTRLENASKEDLGNLLVSEELIRFKTSKRYVAAEKFVDPSGNEMWSVNVMVGDEDDTFVEGGRSWTAYSRS